MLPRGVPEGACIRMLISLFRHELGILAAGKHTVDELLPRTSDNTRRGQEFSFKPTSLEIGAVAGADAQFYPGFTTCVARSGKDVHTDKPLASSFWIRFYEESFLIRAFCSDHDDTLALTPYEGHVAWRNVVPGGVQLRATPFRYTHRLQQVLKIGGEPIYDRHATEADFSFCHRTEDGAGMIYAVGDPCLMINPGLWLAHRVALDMTTYQYKLFWMCMIKLRMHNLYPDIGSFTKGEPPSVPLPDWNNVKPSVDDFEFATRYLVEALLSHSIVTLPEIEELSRTIRPMRPELRLAVLEGLFGWTRRASVKQDIRDISRRVSWRRAKVADHVIMTRRCLVTPTRCLLNPPLQETSSSLLRHFADLADRFLRVQFVDDEGDFPITGETLAIDRLCGAQGVFARVRRALDYGIYVAGRRYDFLCFSESQAREHGCWMIAEEGRFTAQNVRSWMGDLTEERIVAKHAARHSLALSTTRAVKLDVKITRGWPDIKRNGYTFTDGASQCAQALADECARILGHTATPVSAFQFRDGGVKGVASVVQDPTLGDFELRERDSCVKFKSNVRELSVLKVATHARATLNRQAILLMEGLGVSKYTLLSIFRAEKRAIEGLEDGFDPRRLAAVSVFPLTSVFDFHIRDDPFVANIESLVKSRLLSDLKWKAWVEIEKSAFLMGVPDATDSLKEGEVFCQVQLPYEAARVITGRCLIYRNPCLHPGDIRLVEAVDCPSLRHLRNVIVFNTCGQRDLPNMLSGGDLDGDMYSLVWDERLLIPPQNMHEPMDYTPPIPIRSDFPITVEQTKEHFLDFMRNDVLGRVCNTHMALADQYGPDCFLCLDLAQLASEAVDFCKTGVPVSHTSIPKVDEYPDFMGKEARSIRVFKKKAIQQYKSEKALGLMFREIDPEPVFEVLDADFLRRCGDPRILACEDPVEYVDYLEAVAVHKVRYEFELEGLLRRYDICEAECIAGLLMRSRKTRIKMERDYDLRVAVREAYATLKAAANERTDHYLEQHPSGRGKALDRRAWALASYKLTYDTERFASYSKIDWKAVDADLFGDEEENEAIEEILRGVLGNAGQEGGPMTIARRFSFGWLLHQEIFEILAGLSAVHAV